MFKKYDRKIRETLLEKTTDTDWKKILKHHREMISYIQHERLIHLLVTLFVGLVMSMTSLIAIVTQKIELLAIAVPLLLLFIGYLFHYRFLENTTQEWYQTEGKIKSKLL